MAFTVATEILAQTGGDAQWGLIALGIGIIVLGAGVLAFSIIRKRRAGAADSASASDAAGAQADSTGSNAPGD